LRPYLDAAFEAALEGAVHVIARYRDTNCNLRTQLLRIIKRAGVKPWPKLFHNLRASRETDLAAEYPLHVVCDWIGNTERIAKKHYLQTTEDYFERAAKSAAPALQNPVQHGAVSGCKEPQQRRETAENTGDLQVDAVVCGAVQEKGMTPTGFEPVSRP
jgi:hypothetical protein